MVATPRIPLNTLRVFEAAARCGSFVQAGEELNVTAAAVSHRVKELETSLGVSMFTRLARGVELTEAGRRYRDEIADAFRQIERATAMVGQTTVAGPLTVSMPESVAQFWLLPRLHRLASYAPGIELSIEADSHLSHLDNGAADIAIRFGSGEYPGFDSQPLFADAVTLVAASQAASDPVDNRAHAIIRKAVLLEDYGATDLEPWMHWRPWLRELGLTAADAAGTLRFSNSALTVMASVAGTGICIGRMSLVLNLITSGELNAILPWRTTEMAHYLISRPGAAHNPRVHAFYNWLQHEIDEYRKQVYETTRFELPLTDGVGRTGPRA